MSADPFGVFYTWPLTVERKAGRTATGRTYDASDTSIKAKVRLVTQLVTDAEGSEVEAVATITMSPTHPAIPTGSRVTLPPELGGAVTEVITEGLHDAGPDLPRYYQLTVA